MLLSLVVGSLQVIKNVWTTNNVRKNISFVVSDVVCWSSRLSAFQTLLSSPRLTTPQKNNMQQMVNKYCLLLGEKFGSFDRGLTNGPQIG